MIDIIVMHADCYHHYYLGNGYAMLQSHKMCMVFNPGMKPLLLLVLATHVGLIFRLI